MDVNPLFAQQQAIQGFLGTRGSIMLDVVFLAMFAIVPAMALSIFLVKYRGRYQLHKQIQLALGTVLLLAVVAFEVDMRFLTDWEVLADPSPYFAPGTWNPVWYSLVVHLCFAIPSALLWIYVIVQALRKFPSPPIPGSHSAEHKFWAWLAASFMTMTAVTGWIFYWLAFVAA